MLSVSAPVFCPFGVQMETLSLQADNLAPVMNAKSTAGMQRESALALINLSPGCSYPGFQVIVSLVHNFLSFHFTAYLLGFRRLSAATLNQFTP